MSNSRSCRRSRRRGGIRTWTRSRNGSAGRRRTGSRRGSAHDSICPRPGSLATRSISRTARATPTSVSEASTSTGPLSYATKTNPPCFRTCARTREHDRRSRRRHSSPWQASLGARVGAASDPPFLVKKLPRGGVLIALSLPGRGSLAARAYGATDPCGKASSASFGGTTVRRKSPGREPRVNGNRTAGFLGLRPSTLLNRDQVGALLQFDETAPACVLPETRSNARPHRSIRRTSRREVNAESVVDRVNRDCGTTFSRQLITTGKHFGRPPPPRNHHAIPSTILSAVSHVFARRRVSRVLQPDLAVSAVAVWMRLIASASGLVVTDRFRRSETLPS